MQENKSKETNFWPYAIVGMILTVVLVGIWTIKVAVDNPVQEADDYMMKYQDVEENINEIMAKQKAFFARFDIDLSMNRFHLGENRVTVKVLEKKSREPVANAQIYAVVTRPTTKKYDKILKNFSYKEGRYVSEPFKIKRIGRWNIQVKVTVGKEVGFAKYKTFVKE
ncbi:FixH family protein [Hydrogenimonas sp. SS33]|uniref:FixH family protein n=1 Tax=Hydrogenimonas leucolamina TaxID=2954236 RepID=UPI00336BD4DE